ncbi:MAG: tetratricopeptide repeat protein [Bacteroidales bacterium]|nr:tetratricopeptide repeat protein [Bacteroidales bacterium]
MKTLILVLALTISLLSACSKSSQIDKIIDRAEAVIMEHPDSALEMLDKIERVELAEGKQRSKFSLLYAQAMNKNYIDSNSDSLTAVALEYYKDNGTDREKALAYYYHGVIKYNADLYTEAIDFFIQAKIYAEKTDDHYTRGLIYHVIGGCYFTQCDRRTALEYHKMALEEYLQTGNKPNIFMGTKNVGMMYRMLGMYEEAIPYLLDAKKMALELNETQLYLNLSITLENIGYYKFNQTSVTEEWLELFKNEKDLTKYHLGMAIYYDRTNQLDSAILHYKKKLELIKQHSIYSVEDFRVVSEIFERMGDLTSALVYERKYRRGKDSLYRVNLSNVAKEVEQKYLAKHYKESYKLLRSRHIYMIVAYSFIFIAAIMLIIYTIRRFRKMIKKREIEIEEYREYITDAIEQKNELENRCKELEINSRTANSNNIPRFISLLHNRIRNLQSLTELAHIHQNNPGRFYSEFKEQLKVSKNTYTEFMDELYSMTDLYCNGIMTHLKNEYPDLTKYELSYCALICLGFSQESIRILMNHNNINSIYTLRTKIRKKMSIPAGDSVLEKHIRELVGRLVNNEMM